VRPFEDPTNWKKHMSTWLSYAFGLVLVVTGGPFLIDDILRQPLPVEEMHRTTGTIVAAGTESMGSGGRGGSGGRIGYVVVSTPSKSEETFYTGDTRVKLLLGHRVGQAITVWWQPSFSFGFWKVGTFKRAFELYVEDVDWYVLKYSADRPRQIAFDSKDHYWYLSMLGLGLFLLVKPVWAHRKPRYPEFP